MVKVLRLGTRMGFGFATIVLVFTLAILATYINLLELNKEVTLIREFNVPKVTHASGMRSSMFHMRLAMLRAIITGGLVNKSKNAEDVHRHRAALLDHIAEFEKLVQLHPFPEELEPLKVIKENLAVIIPFQEQLLNSTEIDEETFAVMSRHAYIVIENNDKIMAFERDRIAQRAQLATDEVKATERLFIIALSIGIVLAALMSFFMTRSVTQPVEDMRLLWSNWQQRAHK